MPTAKANGKTFNFPEGTTPEQMGQAIDEYFAKNPPAQSARPATAAGQPQDPSTLQRVGNFFTGNDRRTPEMDQVPELAEVGLSAFLGDQAGALKAFRNSAATLTAMDPEDVVSMVRANNPDIRVVYNKDAQGNQYPVLHNPKNGATAMINKPGVSGMDLAQGTAMVAGFTPAGRGATATGSILGNAARVGTLSAATQGAMDLNQQAQGRDGDEVSLSNVRAGDVVTAGLGGAGFQALFQGLARMIPAMRQTASSQGITPGIRNAFKKEAERIGMDPADINDDLIRQALEKSNPRMNAQQALARQGEEEFGIQLTRGQRTLDDSQLSFEDRARVGLAGDKPQRMMRSFEQETQQPQIQAAREAIEQRVGGGPLGSRAQAGATVRESIQQAERKAASAVDEAYEQVGDAALRPDAINKLFNATRKAVIGADKDRNLKATQGILNQLRRSQKVMTDLGKAGAQIKPKHINEIEQMRRRLNTAVGSAENATDRAQVLQMKRALDDFMDDAVQKALFEGDDQALSALKNARSVFKEYAQKFRASSRRTRSGRTIPDQEGAFIEKIVEANPTDEQIVNAVFGASNFSNQAGAKMAQRFKTILGDESEGWKAVRQEALRRLIKTNRVNNEEIVSGSKTLSAIRDAMDKNESLMKELFTPEEIGLLRRFGAQVKRTQPDLVRSRENPSGTAQVAGKALSDTIRRIGGMFAFGGEPTLALTSAGVSAGRGLRSTSRAKDAVRPFEQATQAKPDLPGAATGATLYGESVE